MGVLFLVGGEGAAGGRGMDGEGRGAEVKTVVEGCDGGVRGHFNFCNELVFKSSPKEQ